MDDYVYSTEYPAARREQGEIVVPWGITEIDVVSEMGGIAGKQFRYLEARIPDTHQDLGDIAVVKSAILAAIKKQAGDRINSRYPWWVQSNVANGIYPVDVGDTMRDAIASIITESNRCEDLVAASVTPQAAQSIIPSWPEI
jgi:hypothetical protein